MKTIIALILIGSASLLHGCAYPEPAKIEQNDARPAIGVAGAPEGSILYVDGLAMGAPAQYDGEIGVLLIESGKHRVEVKGPDGAVLYAEEIFLSGSTTKILNYTP